MDRSADKLIEGKQERIMASATLKHAFQFWAVEEHENATIPIWALGYWKEHSPEVGDVLVRTVWGVFCMTYSEFYARCNILPEAKEG